MAGECSEELEAPSDEVIITTTGTEEPIRSIDGQSFDDKPTPSPSPPDRNLFQSSLSEINACISQHTKRLNQLVGRNGQSSLIEDASSRRKAILSQREDLKKETDRTKAELEEKIKIIEDVRSQMKHMEPELHWKNAERLDKEIKTFEDRYNSRLNNREEKVVVAELDKLKRNKKRLEGYNILMAKRSEIECEISVLKLKRDADFTTQRNLRKDQMNEAKTQFDLKEEARRCRQQLSELIDERKAVVSQYETDRDEYAQWVAKNRKAALKASSSFPATFPAAHKNNADFVDVQELEPFYEQKRDCRLLIAYLERYEKEQTGHIHEENGANGVAAGAESADEFPEAFKQLAVQPLRKKKSHKKLKEKQPLSHGIDIYKLFGQLEIDPPKYPNEVAVSLEKVRAQLTFHESQTIHMDWDEDQYGLGAHAGAGTIARSMSTVDSAFDHSETMSMNSGRFALSPIILSRRDSKRQSRNDEGEF
ncbi:hypothetical protein PRIPAC_70784 [Pristionchus pacificus]|uniref:Uncharacterized protein n=1 Tax=Pristionchus pacificus TaxID=54126 RepID=A0A454Y688_PRIPA|nr:hypothetical protein PRIPAC_70784 [Pristionchus pacificus]|eukprot:PDM60985.1 hypothetical protein PRIPAC_54791 [Pristionchus pacificus]